MADAFPKPHPRVWVDAQSVREMLATPSDPSVLDDIAHFVDDALIRTEPTTEGSSQ